MTDFSPTSTPDGFDAVSVQNVGSTYIIVSWDLPTDSNGILINFSLYCNGALAGVLPLTVISYNTTGLLPFTLYMYMSSSHSRRHCTPVGTWCWASSVLQPACPDYTVTDRNKENEFNDIKSYELGGDGSNGCILPTGIMIRCFFILSSSCHPLYL
eukprot:Em0218g1a